MPYLSIENLCVSYDGNRVLNRVSLDVERGKMIALLGTIALWVAAILTMWSMFHYLRLAAPYLRDVDGMTELRTTVTKARDKPPA